MTTGVECFTGPLGQGVSQAAGMAAAQKHLAARFNTDEFQIFDNYTYCICGDGCIQEGITAEAGALAGHMGLGNLVVLWDDNHITIDGDTDISFTEDVVKRFEAHGWHVEVVPDVAQGIGELREAIKRAHAIKDKPSLLKVRTVIGEGSPSKAGKQKAHGAPLGAEDLAGAKRNFGLDPTKMFHFDDDVKAVYAEAGARAEAKHSDWVAMFDRYAEAFPEKAAEIKRRFANELPEGIFDKLPSFEPTGTAADDKKVTNRIFSQDCLQSIAHDMPELMGGSADLTHNNMMYLNCKEGDWQRDTPAGRQMYFGIREHAMAAMCNGMFAYGGFRPFCGTFMSFSGYMVGAMRLSAMSKFGVTYILTHDSIGTGEDGPTHQPIEILEGFRATPNMDVYRPCDLNEMAAAYQSAMSKPHTPTVVSCCRTKVPNMKETSKDGALKGAYTLVDSKDPKLVIIATGSEVHLAVKAAAELGDSVKVVSMPCQEVFLEQSEEYRRSVLPDNVARLSVEASACHGWHRFSHAQISVKHFGKSGSGEALFEYYGYSVENIVAQSKKVMEFYADKSVPNLNNFIELTPPNDTSLHYWNVPGKEVV